MEKDESSEQYEEMDSDDDLSPGDDSSEVKMRVEDMEATFQRPILTKLFALEHSEVVDDFLRNFLIKAGMNKTFACFQSEWYEIMPGLLTVKQMRSAPDIHTHNQLLESEIKRLTKQIECFKAKAVQREKMLVDLRKKRDFHRVQRRHVEEEKKYLIDDIKRLMRFYSYYNTAPPNKHQ